MANRLERESSPYLQQHADNPVDWYPWGEEAFSRAKAEDKPVFVSIGYAACHWCHVMAHESFEDIDIADLMNELFVNVKVDREERPDVDAVYMNAIHVMGEGGGWPLSAFCDPDGRPYFVGTYFPPSDRYGRPGFSTVLKTMSRIYREQRDKVEQNALAVLDGLRQIDEHYRRGAVGATAAALDAGLLVTAGRFLAQRSDPEHGGLGSKPKFPSSSAQDLLGRAGRLKFGDPARAAFLLQAERMAKGGIYDHLGGGFARYSVDEKWLVPHFEKMLYDNGQLLGIYADAYAMTGDAMYARVIEETAVWLEREMLDESGGLYASQDADSEGEEGKFYVWTPSQVDDALGPADAIFFKKVYGVTERGNFEHGTTVLSRIGEIGSDADERSLAEMRRRLFERRADRIPPATDTKILASWNAMAVSGLLRAHARTGSERARALALRVAEFLAAKMVDGDRVARVFKDGSARLDGTIDDYAQVAEAFLDVAEATSDRAWWDRGRALLGAVRARFYEEKDGVGVFYMPAADSADRLVYRPESHHDGATPSGAAVAVDAMLRVGLIAGDTQLFELAERYLAGRVQQAAQQPFMGSRLLSALDRYLHGTELVVTDGAGRDELLASARRAYAPTLMIAGSWAQPSLLEGRTSEAGKARAFVCRGQTCSAPIADPAELTAALVQP